MVTVSWDRKGMLMVEFMQQGTIIMPEVYCKTLKKKCAEQKAWNADIRCRAPPCDAHTAAHTQTLLEHFKWELFEHPVYSYLPEKLIRITVLQQ
jgi:hypothetical protein